MEPDEIVAAFCADQAANRPVPAPWWLDCRYPAPPAYKRKHGAWQRAAFAVQRGKARGIDTTELAAEAKRLQRVYQAAKRKHDRWLQRDTAWMAYHKALSERMTCLCGPGWARIVDKAMGDKVQVSLADAYRQRVRAHATGFCLPSKSPAE